MSRYHHIGLFQYYLAFAAILVGIFACLFMGEVTKASAEELPAIQITISGVSAVDHIYDKTTVVELSGGELQGVNDEDVVSFILHDGIAATCAVGDNIAVSTNIELVGEDCSKYSLIQPTDIVVNIIAKELTLAGVSAPEHEYDGDTKVALSGGILQGVVSGDDVSFECGQGIVQDKNVGTDKQVTTSIELLGADSGNYSLKQPTDISVDIVPKEISISGVVALERVYDGSNKVELTGGLLQGILEDDQVGYSLGEGVLDSKSAGDNKTVATNIVLTGVDSSNYTLSQPTGIVVNIQKKALNIIDVEAVDKEYDGTTQVGLSGGRLIGIYEEDDIGFSLGEGNVQSKNVASMQLVNTAIALFGADCDNYTIIQPVNIFVNITAREISVSGIEALAREYNGGTSVNLIKGTLDNIIIGDDIDFNVVAAHVEQKNVGVWGVNYELNLVGTDCLNYALTQKCKVECQIKAKTLTIDNIIAQDKIYDGDLHVVLQGGILVGYIEGDDISFELGVGELDDKNVANGKSVTVNATLSGNDNSNYILSIETPVLVNVLRREVTIKNIFAENRQENGTTKVQLNGGVLDGIILGDDVQCVLGEGTIDGTQKGKYLLVPNVSLTGADALNYSVKQPTAIPVEIYAQDRDVGFFIFLSLTAFFAIFGMGLLVFTIAFRRKNKNNAQVTVANNDDGQLGDVGIIPNCYSNKIDELTQKNRELSEKQVELQQNIESLQEELKEKNDYVDYKNVVEKKILPYAQEVLTWIHGYEDNLATIAGEAANNMIAFISTVRDFLADFLKDISKNSEVKLIFSENMGIRIDFNIHDVVSSKLSSDSSLHATVYRTLCPGMRTRDFVLKEKVIAWKN